MRWHIVFRTQAATGDPKEQANRWRDLLRPCQASVAASGNVLAVNCCDIEGDDQDEALGWLMDRISDHLVTPTITFQLAPKGGVLCGTISGT